MLTLQTGTAYQERLGLGRDELAVLAGDQAVRELYGTAEKNGGVQQAVQDGGSESCIPLFQTEVLYEGLPDGPLSQWLAATPGAAALVSAPVLACTVDHLQRIFKFKKMVRNFLFLYLSLDFQPRRLIAFIPLQGDVPGHTESIPRCALGIAFPVPAARLFPNCGRTVKYGLHDGIVTMPVGAKAQGNHGVHARVILNG